MLEHLRLETLVGLGAASLLGYVLWGPKTTKSRAANAAGALAGLQNIGNSCFLNAVLQALASSPAVIRWLSGPPSAAASPAHRQLRAALIDVIQVVNRTHPERRADPFTPAGVVACLLRLGWLIRRDEQDTHEMFYVLVSTLREEPPPAVSLSADGLRAGDGPVEADTGEALVDWGALGARMRGDARDICGAGARRRGDGGVRREGGDAGSVVRENGDVEVCPETGVRVGAGSCPVKDTGAVGCDTGSGLSTRENGDVASAPVSNDDGAKSHTVDEGRDSMKNSGAVNGMDNGNQTPRGAHLSDSAVTGSSPTVSSLPEASSSHPAVAINGLGAANGPSAEVGSPSEAIGCQPAVVSSPTAAISIPSSVLSSPTAAISSPSEAIGCQPAVVSSPAATVSRPTAAISSLSAAVSSPSSVVSSPAAAGSGPLEAISSQSAVVSSPSSAVSSLAAAVSSPVALVSRPASLGSPGGGVVGRRRRQGIVHRVRSADTPSWRGVPGQLRSPFTGTVSTQLVCQNCQHKCAVRWENFESLSLPLPAAPRPQSLSLPALLGQFSARETVHDVTCDACHRRGRFSKRTLVAKLPSALCLHLPRTTWQDNGQAGKRGDHVSFFETLNMFPYTYAANVTTSAPGRPVTPPLDSGRHTYRLTAVIVHSGGASSGHFITYRRRPDPSDGSWFYTSDTVISRASASEVLSAAAYMLFYDRVPAVAASGAASPVAGASPVAAALLSPLTPALLSPGPGSPLLTPTDRERR